MSDLANYILASDTVVRVICVVGFIAGVFGAAFAVANILGQIGDEE